MQPNDVDPSLRTGEPLRESLEDGFSPPSRETEAAVATQPDPGEAPGPALGPKSPF